MKNLIKIFPGFLVIFLFSGCLLFHKVSYDINIDEPGKGTARVIFYDIRSDAKDNNEFEEDKKNLFNYLLKSDEFITEIKKEGKNITQRDLFVEGDTLNGRSFFSFDNISAVEGIVHEHGFYYLTLPLEDSVITTNGEIIHSKDYKRILWDSRVTNLQFEIYSTDFAEGGARKLARFYNEK